MKLKMVAALLALPLLAVPAVSQTASAPRPKLIVAISVDQFSADLFAQYRQHFTGGLARLSGGVVFPAGYQSHAATETCPGHSTILTGSRPARTGIIANSWFDLSVRRDDTIYCAEDERIAGSTSRNYTVSPLHLRVSTLGDYMERENPASQTVVVSGKDRSAIMMGGQAPDQRWWWHRGRFVSHPRVTAPASVRTANAAIDEALARPRAPFALPAICEARSRAVPIEGGSGPVGDGRFARGPLAENRRDDFRRSPDFDSAVLALAAALREEMRLGEGAATDLLVLGLAATDYVGHGFGTQGSEMCIQLVELDRALGAFFDRLDATGIDYVVMLTADHGGLDVPERARQQAAGGAARVDPELDAETMGRAIGAQLGIAGPVLHGDGAFGDIYLDRALDARDRDRARDEAVRRYRGHPQVAAVFTWEEIAATPSPSGPPDRWSLIERARASFDRERSGDFVVLLQPRVTPIFDTNGGYVATHGSAWDYDRRVPILFWRRGLASFEQPMAVETADILPTLAPLVGLAIPPGTIDGRCLDLIEGPETSCPGQ